MASSLVSQNVTNSSKLQDPVLFEKRPPMLKDFLRGDCNYHPCSSSSSNGSRMYPRKNPCKSTLPIPSKTTKPSMVLLRSRSRKAAATTISAIHKVINVVKFFPFVKSSLVLHRQRSIRNISDVTVKVKIKDILRWKSFRDLMEERSTPMDFSSSPHRQCTTATTTTTSCSRRSSWCDSDFTAEDLPPWYNENADILGKKCVCVHSDTTATSTNSKGWSLEDHDDQQSPVSVLESTLGENEGYFSPLYRSTANSPRMSSNVNFKEVEEEEVQEKDKVLLNYVVESCLFNTSENNSNYHLMFDFFMEELTINEKLHNGDDQFDSEILRTAKCWLNGEINESYEWEVLNKREAYVRDMEKGVAWKKFKHEQEEISKELEENLWNDLINMLLNDLLIKL